MASKTDTQTATQDGLDAFGIEFVEPEAVPAAPRVTARNDALWGAIQAMLPKNPGNFARVRVYNSVTGAPQKASSINNGHDKKFPKDKWAARYTVDRDGESSVLYLAYKNEDGSVNA